MADKVSCVVPVDDLQDGQMKEIDMSGTPVLLVKDGGKISALGGKCTHYGAPLKTGVYSNGRVRCPWHGGCFNTTTGDIEDFPACGSLPVFEVRVDGTTATVECSKDKLAQARVFKTTARNPSDNRTYVIIGGGAAGSAAVQTLRGSGYAGRIILISRENALPYDRTKLSKAMDSNVDNILLNNAEFFQNAGVELILGTEVTELDADAKSVKLSSGQVVTYDKVLVASGADAQKLAFLKGHNGKNVFTLRTPSEANKIFEVVAGKKVAIVGSSFIGMEVAAAIVKRAAHVHVVGMEKVPFERVLGLQVGSVLQKFHEANGVKITMGVNVQEFVMNEEGIVSAIQLKDGNQIPAEVFVIGAGAVPATAFIKPHPKITRDERDKSIICNEFLEAGPEGFFVAGDAARWPLSLLDGRLVRIEHWGMAQIAGAVAAANMLKDKSKSISKHCPVFWTAQHGKSFRYAGHALEYDEIIFDDGTTNNSAPTEPSNPKFAAYYSLKGKIVALLTVQRDPLVAQFSEVIHSGKSISTAHIKEAIAKDGNSARVLADLLAH